MNFKNHLIIGLISGALAGIIVCNIESMPDFLNIIVSVFFGAIGASIPDTLEPSKSWSHRQFFHSQRMLFGLGLVFVLLIITRAFWSKMLLGFILLGTIVGYLSHLIADATTPARLPP